MAGKRAGVHGHADRRHENADRPGVRLWFKFFVIGGVQPRLYHGRIKHLAT